MEFMTVKQAAERLGISVSTLRRWATAGRLAYHRTEGGHRRFRAVDVANLVDELNPPMNFTPPKHFGQGGVVEVESKEEVENGG